MVVVVVVVAAAGTAAAVGSSSGWPNDTDKLRYLHTKYACLESGHANATSNCPPDNYRCHVSTINDKHANSLGVWTATVLTRPTRFSRCICVITHSFLECERRKQGVVIVSDLGFTAGG